MARRIIIFLMVLVHLTSVVPESAPVSEPSAPRVDDTTEASDEPPEGYYAFVESPNATPPRVRPPPYRQVSSECAEARALRAHVSAHNLCGDLNRGVIPINPMGQNPNGEPYPFDLIRNHTLRFLSRTLPVLRADDTLPRVTHLTDLYTNRLEDRHKRSLSEAESGEEDSDSIPSRSLRAEHRADTHAQRDGRKFCDGGGVFCMLYRAINGDGESSSGVERREDPGPAAPHPQHPNMPHHRYEGPPTPCPARVEYATPVFARNYQGVWRYVVQIPYEGYFTQTVEVTRCMQSRCHYLEGGCLSSPRWVSLLVAELHYPSQQNLQPEYQQLIQNRAGPAPDSEPATDKPAHCDGHDHMGCYQVRLYYDWFLVPGSCKCWRPDYFARYVRRNHNNNNNEL